MPFSLLRNSPYNSEYASHIACLFSDRTNGLEGNVAIPPPPIIWTRQGSNLNVMIDVLSSFQRFVTQLYYNPVSKITKLNDKSSLMHSQLPSIKGTVDNQQLTRLDCVLLFPSTTCNGSTPIRSYLQECISQNTRCYTNVCYDVLHRNLVIFHQGNSHVLFHLQITLIYVHVCIYEKYIN